jgi:hypothetical protein
MFFRHKPLLLADPQRPMPCSRKHRFDHDANAEAGRNKLYGSVWRSHAPLGPLEGQPTVSCVRLAADCGIRVDSEKGEQKRKAFAEHQLVVWSVVHRNLQRGPTLVLRHAAAKANDVDRI